MFQCCTLKSWEWAWGWSCVTLPKSYMYIAYNTIGRSWVMYPVCMVPHHIRRRCWTCVWLTQIDIKGGDPLEGFHYIHTCTCICHAYSNAESLHGYNYDNHYHGDGKEDTDHNDDDECCTAQTSTSLIIGIGGCCLAVCSNRAQLLFGSCCVWRIHTV